jgi:hypothetical protein
VQKNEHLPNICLIFSLAKHQVRQSPTQAILFVQIHRSQFWKLPLGGKAGQISPMSRLSVANLGYPAFF